MAKLSQSQQDPFILELLELYPYFIFRSGSKFKFRPPKTIYLGPPEPNYRLLALHELGHALCGHKGYQTLVQRLKIESEAWERARQVLNSHPEWSQKYHLHFNEDFVESQLDTYRDWLHQKTLCPSCGLTRYQTLDGLFHCPHCDHL